MFLDIDCKDDVQKALNIDAIQQLFQEVLLQTTQYCYLTTDLLACSVSNNKYRIYSNIAAHPKICLLIAQTLKKMLFKQGHGLESTSIDTSVYNSCHLRLPESYKLKQEVPHTFYKRFYKTSGFA